MGQKSGDRIGEYVLRERLGEGGGGAVWKAQHSFITNKWAALKFPHDESVVAWLRKEGLLQSRLQHPNVVQVFGGNLEGPSPYIVMELVDGSDLRQALKSGPLPAPRVRAIARGILLALAAAHDIGVVHGDLKPENVLLTRSGAVKLSDFGLAQSFISGELQHSLTVSSHQVAGTLRYVPPELLEWGAPTPKTDLYSFGVLLFELLVGRIPQGLESPSAHAVNAPARDRLFRACYAPEARRLSSAARALELLEEKEKPGPAPASGKPRGRLIEKPKKLHKKSSGFFTRWIWGDEEAEAETQAQEQASAPPAPASPPLTPSSPQTTSQPRPVTTRLAAPVPSSPPSSELLGLLRSRTVNVGVACGRSEKGQWLWEHVDSFLRRPDREVLALDLSGRDQVGDADLETLGGLLSLRSLDLSENVRVSGRGLAHLNHLSSLTYLSLRGCTQVDDAGLDHLGSMRLLSSLDLSGCTRITDAGLRALGNLGSLRFLFLDGCSQVTQQGIERLQKSAPLQWVSA